MRGRAFFVIASPFVACSSFEEGATSPSPAVDGGTDVDSATGPAFCASDGGTWCEDFDDPRSAVFPIPRVADGGILEVVSTTHVSAPNALRVAMPAVSTTTCVSVLRERSGFRQHSPNGFVAEFKLRLSAIGGPTDVGCNVVMVNEPGTERCGYYLQATPDALTYAVQWSGGNETKFNLGRKALIDEWTSVVVDVHGIPGFRRITVTVGGVKALDEAIPSGCQNDTYVESLVVGSSCIKAASGKVDLALDDVRVLAR